MFLHFCFKKIYFCLKYFCLKYIYILFFLKYFCFDRPQAESRQRRSWRRPIEGVFRTVFGVGRDGKRKEWQQQQQRLAAEVEDEHSRAMEQETPPAKKNAKRTRKGDSHETSRRTKWKRKALRKWWRRVLEKAGVGGSKKVKRDGLAEAKARLVEELRKRLEQHPEELRIRAKAVLHELDDGMLLRYG